MRTRTCDFEIYWPLIFPERIGRYRKLTLNVRFWRSKFDNHTASKYLRATSELFQSNVGPLEGLKIQEGGWPRSILVGFYADIFWESRCSIRINVWHHFYKILLVFDVHYQVRVKVMSGKSWNYQKMVKVKGCLKLSFFLWFTHWWNRLCETDWLDS